MRVFQLLQTSFGDFLSLFFPNYCESCSKALGNQQEILCISCLALLPRTHYHQLQHEPIKSKLMGILEVSHSYSFLKYEKKGQARKLLHAIKYRNKPEIGSFLAYSFGKELQEDLEIDFDIIIPIPLHESKLIARGYNQSDAIAEGFSKAWQVPWSSKIVRRAIANPTQTKKNRLERWKNVDGIFEVADLKAIEGKHVLLVDDVITSGATIEACGREILKKGAAKLSIACLATGA